MQPLDNADPFGRFRYQPLDPELGEIRLVRIEINGDETLPIRLALRHVPLDKDIIYRALSYTWGDKTPTHDIHLRGDGPAEGIFSVRQNLYDFLAQMRTEQEESWFWIDQVCINQDDQSEKSRQIRRMSDIYSTAKEVTVWLGPSFEGSDHLMNCVKTFSNIDDSALLEAFRRYVLKSNETQTSTNDEDGYTPGTQLTCHKMHDMWTHCRRVDAALSVLLSKDASRSGESIRLREVEIFWNKCRQTSRGLLNLPYFRRVWVIQELVLSWKRIVRIGSQSVNWNHLNKFSKDLKGYSSIKGCSHDPTSTISGWQLGRLQSLVTTSSCVGLSSMAGSYSQPEDDLVWDWYTVLGVVVSSQCTNAKDKAYGILGLLPERLRVLPDYDLELGEIVFDLMRLQIAERIAIMDRNCMHEDYYQQYVGPWKLFKLAMLLNIAEPLAAALATSVWYYEMHRDEEHGIELEKLQSFISHELFPVFRAQRLAHGSRWLSPGPRTGKVIARLLAPRKHGLLFWSYRKVLIPAVILLWTMDLNKFVPRSGIVLTRGLPENELFEAIV
jgi:hypothetical protein